MRIAPTILLLLATSLAYVGVERRVMGSRLLALFGGEPVALPEPELDPGVPLNPCIA